MRIPTNAPTLRHRLPIPAPVGPFRHRPRIDGTADALYAAVGDGMSTVVTHYRDGNVAWRARAGLAQVGPVHLVADRLLVSTHDFDSDSASELVALDRDTGAFVWSRRMSRLTSPRSEGNRWFLITDGGPGTGAYGAIEFDPSTGSELNRFVSRTRLVEVTLGFAVVDESAETAQLIGFDLRPTGPPALLWHGVRWYFDRDEFGWIAATGGGAFGISPDGDLQFRCDPTIPKFPGEYDRNWDWVVRIDERTVVVMAEDAVEAFDVSSSKGTSIWGVGGSSANTDFDEYDNRLMRRTFPTDPGGTVVRWGVGARVDALDWRTGATIATGTDQLILDDTGRTATHEGDTVVAREAGSGDELWRIPAPRSAELAMRGSAVLLVTADADSATLDVYSDDSGS